MIYQNKAEFIGGLKNALSRYEIAGIQEIVQDFEQHFSDGAAAGETEQQVCEKLGDPEEIAKQYISEQASPDQTSSEQTSSRQTIAQPASDGFGSEPYGSKPQMPPPYNGTQNNSPDAGKIVGIICVDLLIFSWAIPALLSLILGLCSLTLGLGFGGIGVFIGGAVTSIVSVEWITATISPLSTILLGVVMISGAALLVLLCIKASIGFINVILRIINWHSRAIAGRSVCTYIGKKKADGAAA